MVRSWLTSRSLVIAMLLQLLSILLDRRPNYCSVVEASSLRTNGNKRSTNHLLSNKNKNNKSPIANSHSITRHLEKESLSDPSHCYPLLHASASPQNTIDRERYFYFVDAMSNSYFSTTNSSTSYETLPTVVKYSFVTLSCQCQLMGGKVDCCVEDKAKLDVEGADPDGPAPTDVQRVYLNNICVTTSGSIGDNVLPPSGELPVEEEEEVEQAVTEVQAPTASPIVEIQSVVESPGNSKPPAENENVVAENRGLSAGAWVGIAIAGAAVGTLLIYLVSRGKDESKEDEEVENAALNDDVHDLAKERIETSQIGTGGDDDAEDNGPPSPTSTNDATQSMTADASDVSSLPSTIGGEDSFNAGYVPKDTNLLPGRPDEESVLSGDDENYLVYERDGNTLAKMGAVSSSVVGIDEVPSNITDDECSISSKSVSSSVLLEDAIIDPNQSSVNAALPPRRYTPGELDQAIENGNWEAVAASAAAIVNQNDVV